MHLSFRQLATFREVMRSGSISQAAKTLGRSQPAVSIMISTLEDELGFFLFLREHGKVTPTPEAHYFLEEADAILARLERTKQAMSRVSTLKQGRLRVACHPAASGYFMPRVMTRFLRDKGDVDVSLVMRSSDVIEDLVASQQFDIGFAETHQERASIAQTKLDLECVCILPADDPLAAQPDISPKDLDGKPLAALYKEHATTVQLEAAFAAAGCRLEKRLELQTFLPGLQFVSEGFCYMVSDMITAYSYVVSQSITPNLVIRRFRPQIRNSVSILSPAYASQSLLARAFSRELTREIHDMLKETEAQMA